MASDAKPTPDLSPLAQPPRFSIGICLDCDRTREVATNGTCVVCGSHSVIKRGAIRELRKQISNAKRRKR